MLESHPSPVGQITGVLASSWWWRWWRRRRVYRRTQSESLSRLLPVCDPWPLTCKQTSWVTVTDGALKEQAAVFIFQSLSKWFDSFLNVRGQNLLNSFSRCSTVRTTNLQRPRWHCRYLLRRQRVCVAPSETHRAAVGQCVRSVIS